MLSSLFVSAMEYIIDNEGGFADYKEDSGGPTKYGISLKWYRQSVNEKATKAHIKNLTKDQAKSLYFKHFWMPSNAQQYYVRGDFDDTFIIKYFDTYIWIGPANAKKILNKSNGNIDVFIEDLSNYLKELTVRYPKNQIFLNGWLNRAKRIPKIDDKE